MKEHKKLWKAPFERKYFKLPTNFLEKVNYSLETYILQHA